MNVSTLRIDLRVADCQTAREKRRRVRAILEKLHRHFNVSVAEVDPHDRPGEASVGVVAVAATRREARDLLARVAEAVAAYPRAEVIGQVLNEV